MSEPRIPDLSVVIPSVNGWSDLSGAVAALEAQSGDVDVEVIVADRVGDDVRVPLRREFPRVRVLEAPPEATIPQLRAMAFDAACAPVVGVIEDHVLVPPSWANQMLALHREGAEVVGGSVKNAARDTLLDWAAFLCEYSHCLTPPVGASDWVTGNNVTYRRDLLERNREVIAEGKWENYLHDTLRASGVTLLSRPDIEVLHKKHYTTWEYISQRYLYARSYAGMRLRDASATKKLGYGTATLALPPLLFTRVVSRVLKSGQHRRELILSLPLLALFVTSWAAGEMVGYWRGDGDSLQKVR